MTSRRKLFQWVALTVLAGCEANVDGWTKDDPGGAPDDVQEALRALPNAEVLEWTPDGLPQYIVGEMVKVGAMQSDDPVASDAALRSQRCAGPQAVPPARRMTSSLRKMNVDENGDRHFRYAQTFNGLPVIGGGPRRSRRRQGRGLRGQRHRARRHPGWHGRDADHRVAGEGRDRAVTRRFAGLTPTNTRTVYIADRRRLAAQGVRDDGRTACAARTRRATSVYVDVDSGAIVADYPQIHFAENRKVYSREQRHARSPAR